MADAAKTFDAIKRFLWGEDDPRTTKPQLLNAEAFRQWKRFINGIIREVVAEMDAEFFRDEFEDHANLELCQKFPSLVQRSCKGEDPLAYLRIVLERDFRRMAGREREAVSRQTLDRAHDRLVVKLLREGRTPDEVIAYLRGKGEEADALDVDAVAAILAAKDANPHLTDGEIAQALNPEAKRRGWRMSEDRVKSAFGETMPYVAAAPDVDACDAADAEVAADYRLAEQERKRADSLFVHVLDCCQTDRERKVVSLLAQHANEHGIEKRGAKVAAALRIGKETVKRTRRAVEERLNPTEDAAPPVAGDSRPPPRGDIELFSTKL